MKSCETCLYFTNAECRRFPPTPFETQGSYGTMDVCRRFPKVNSNDWCGEWRSLYGDTPVTGPSAKTNNGGTGAKRRANQKVD